MACHNASRAEFSAAQSLLYLYLLMSFGSISCGSHSYIFAWPDNNSIAKQLDWHIGVGTASERRQIYCAEQLFMQQTMSFYM